MAEVYLLDELVSDQYGKTKIVGVYASKEVAEADAAKINAKGGWAMVHPHPVLTQSQFKTASGKKVSLESFCESWLEE